MVALRTACSNPTHPHILSHVMCLFKCVQGYSMRHTTGGCSTAMS